MTKCVKDDMNKAFEEMQEAAGYDGVEAKKARCISKMGRSHRTHCCSRGCKYGDSDCPVVNGYEEAAYACEDCNCVKFHPELRFDKWWDSLNQEQKEIVFNDYPGDF
jgi:hypothetical protein